MLPPPVMGISKKAALISSILILAVVVSGIFLGRHRISRPETAAATEATESTESTESVDEVIDRDTLVMTDPDQELESPKMRGTRLRGDIEDNLNQIPASLVEFAESLAPSMDAALVSEDRAIALFSQLEGCALDDGVDSNAPFSIRAICASNAIRLAEQYPDKFSERLDELIKDLPPQLRHLVSAGLAEEEDDDES